VRGLRNSCAAMSRLDSPGRPAVRPAAPAGSVGAGRRRRLRAGGAGGTELGAGLRRPGRSADPVEVLDGGTQSRASAVRRARRSHTPYSSRQPALSAAKPPTPPTAPRANSPLSAARSTRPKPPSSATWAPSRPAPCPRPSAASASRPSAPRSPTSRAREPELRQALAASATQQPPTPAELAELASQLRQVVEHAPVTAKKALAQQLVHEIHVSSRYDIRPIFRIPTRQEPSPGEGEKVRSWSDRWAWEDLNLRLHPDRKRPPWVGRWQPASVEVDVRRVWGPASVRRPGSG
jgi:hypothetical protein